MDKIKWNFIQLWINKKAFLLKKRNYLGNFATMLFIRFPAKVRNRKFNLKFERCRDYTLISS